MNIVYTNPSYPEYRTIINKCPGVRYLRSRSIASLFNKIATKMPIAAVSRFLQRSSVAYCGGFRLPTRGPIGAHFFNLVGTCFSRIPYVTTFETMVPYTHDVNNYWFRKALESMESSRCKRLLALCECTKTIEGLFLQKHGFEGIMRKVEVLHPPQRLLANEEDVVRKKYTSGMLRFCFVGSAFSRKGGGDALRVLKRLRADYDVRALIVGCLDNDDGGHMWHEKIDNPAELRKLISENTEWIEYYPRVENSRLMAMMKRCHIGLLPTRSDTYGYSVLEMQSLGVPVVTSNIRALPEINTSDCGWMFAVDKNANGNFPDISRDGVARVHEQIEKGLESCLRGILNNPESIQKKALASLSRIKKFHDPDDYANRLMKIYEESFL